MSVRMVFTATEREKLGVLVNNFCIYATQLVCGDGSALSTRALVNLGKAKKENEDLLRRLDELARESGDESPLRLIEDLTRVPTDVAQMLTLVRRCLAASAFIGHCMAQPTTQPQIPTDAPNQEKRLH